MGTFVARIPAPSGERYTPGAFGDLAGTPVIRELAGGEGIVRAVFVPDGGAYVDVTIEMPASGSPAIEPGSYST